MSNSMVFLSCRDEDASLSTPVRYALEAAHLTIVQDRAAISSAAWFVACVSAGGYVAEELEIAIEKLQRLDHDRSWLLVVPLGECEVPALTITPHVTLRDLVVDPDEIPRRLTPKHGRGTLTTEMEIQRVMASRGTFVGTQVTEPVGGDLHSKTKFEELIVDNDATVIGTVVGKRPE